MRRLHLHKDRDAMNAMLGCTGCTRSCKTQFSFRQLSRAVLGRTWTLQWESEFCWSTINCLTPLQSCEGHWPNWPILEVLEVDVSEMRIEVKTRHASNSAVVAKATAKDELTIFVRF